MDQNNAGVELRQLFQACDRHQRGYIDRHEFGQLCASFHIDPADVDVIFDDLDRDRDQRISLDDFSQGFRDFLQPGRAEEQRDDKPNNSSRRRLKKQATLKAWREFSDRLGHSTIRQFLAHSADHLYGLYEELQESEAPAQLISHFESLMESLVSDARQLEREREKFDQAIRREREQHQLHLKNLEEELEIQVQRVAQVVKNEAEIKCEAEKRTLQQSLESEIAQLQTHLRLFQKVENWLNREQQEAQSRDQQEAVERASSENRQLKLSLVDAQTTLALLQTELSQLKSQYCEKDRLLYSEKEAMLDLVSHQEHVQRQLELLHDANRQLQDTNDSLRAHVDIGTLRRSPVGFLFTRPSSRQDSNSSYCLPLPTDEEVAAITGDSGHSSLMFSEQNEHMLERVGSFRRSHSFRAPQPPSLRNELHLATSSPVPSQKFGHFQPIIRVNNQLTNDHSFRSSDEWEPTGPADRTFKIIFAGDSAVGKSSFISRLHEGVFISNTMTTLGVDYKVKTIRVDERNVAVQLWDTAGQERFRSITQSYYRKADGVMLLFDVSNERSFINIRHWSDCLNDCLTRDQRNLPLVVCGTKADLRPSSEHQGLSCVQPIQAQRLAAQMKAQYIETSAKTGSNVLEALVILTRQMMIMQDDEVQTSGLRLTDRRSILNCCSRN
ncbi:ras and EF-hand domain-containing protein-like [Daphnia magna]|uniref:ras and EF-hand domain-containing protein-like n=1 Tax=Daphnia magna TaxID=35525 RepID=UPI0006E9CEB8|nr:ras and EF-hand domain-containing protein-like [Daphnia magna]